VGALATKETWARDSVLGRHSILRDKPFEETLSVSALNAKLDASSKDHGADASSMGTPSGFQHRSRLPVLGGSRQSFFGPENGSSFQPSPAVRQPLGGGARPSRGFGFGVGTNAGKRAGGGVRDV
jgi:hypothetical protein